MPDRNEKKGGPGKKAGIIALLLAVGYFFRKQIMAAVSAVLRVFKRPV